MGGTTDSHRSTFLKEDGAFSGRLSADMARRIKHQVCSAMQLNYYRRLQLLFSKWQLLTKLDREDEYRSLNRGGVQRDGDTQTKLLLLK